VTAPPAGPGSAAPGAPVVRAAVVDDGPRLAGLFAPADREAAERAVSLVPDADEVGRLLLVAELHGEVRGFASLVWIHHLQLPGPEAHVAELVVAGGGSAAVGAALRAAVREQADLLGAVRIGGPGWRAAPTLPVVRELTVGETGRAVAALRELRPHLPTDDAEVVARIDEVQRPEGYRLLAVLPPDAPHDADDPDDPDGTADGDALAVAGFRRVSNLAWGDVVYVDDLVTRAAARGRGLAAALLTAVDDEARRLGASAVHLDSGHGPDRAAAHRAYLRHGYRLSSHHLSRSLRSP
jgi:GNAT superfamily N-acetyltransferase